MKLPEKTISLLPEVAPTSLPPLKAYLRLVNKKDRALLSAYTRWVLFLLSLSLGIKPLKQKTFNRLYRAVGRPWPQKTLLGYLQKEFVERNLSLSLLLEPLDGAEWLSKNRYDITIEKSSPVLLQLIAPFSRLIAALNNQRPPFYQPFSTLMFLYICLYLLQMPKTIKLLTKARLFLSAPAVEKQLPLLFCEAKQVLSVTVGMKFGLKIAVVLALARRLMKKYNSPAKQKKLNFFDYVNVLLYGLWYKLTIRDNARGLDRL